MSLRTPRHQAQSTAYKEKMNEKWWKSFYFHAW